MVKPPLRTKSIGFKVSEEQYARLEKAARAGGCTLGEWCRQVVLEEASVRELKPIGTGVETQALMAEVVGLRAILLNVLFQSKRLGFPRRSQVGVKCPSIFKWALN